MRSVTGKAGEKINELWMEASVGEKDHRLSRLYNILSTPVTSGTETFRLRQKLCKPLVSPTVQLHIISGHRPMPVIKMTMMKMMMMAMMKKKMMMMMTKSIDII